MPATLLTGDNSVKRNKALDYSDVAMHVKENVLVVPTKHTILIKGKNGTKSQ